MLKRLFVNNEAIASSQNLIRQFHQAEKHEANPVLKPDLPWERAVEPCFRHRCRPRAPGA